MTKSQAVHVRQEKILDTKLKINKCRMPIGKREIKSDIPSTWPWLEAELRKWVTPGFYLKTKNV